MYVTYVSSLPLYHKNLTGIFLPLTVKSRNVFSMRLFIQNPPAQLFLSIFHGFHDLRLFERLSKKYGTEIEWNGEKYYTFPTPKQLRKATVEDLRSLGTGFRDIRIYETTQKVLSGKINLNEVQNKDTLSAREELLTLSGVGPKVADCILLFSTLKRFDVFPIDVWVRRVMNELYIKNEDETKVSKKDIMKIANEKFGNLEGLAQQYLFYWKRES